MKNLYSIFIKIFILFFTTLILMIYFMETNLLITNIIDILNKWLYKIVPSIIIMYTLSSLLLSSKTINIILFIFKPLRKVIKFESNTAFNIFLISILIGNPATISLINDIDYDKNCISNKDKEVLVKCASFINPLFIFSFVNDYKSFLMIYLSHIIANVILAIINTRNNTINNSNNINTNFNFLTMINKLPFLLLLIALYMVISSIIIFSLQEIKINNLLLSLLEISVGSNILIQNDYNILYFVGLISFNGLCIHMQVATILNDYQMYKNFFKGRVFTSIISIIIYSVISSFF